MVRSALLAASVAVLALAVPAGAEPRVPGSGGITLKPLVVPQNTAAPAERASPYATNYSEQVARRLGVSDGGLELLPAPDSRRNPYAPSVSFNGSMVRLKWKP